MSGEQNPYTLYPEHQLDRRPRYYDGMFLKSADYIDAQRYDIDRRRRHLEATVSAGIVAGLEVSARGGSIAVGPGAAVDGRGRQIVLVSEEERVVPAELRGKNAVLYIAYAEQPSDEAVGSKGTTGYTRFHELPAITLVAAGAALPEGAIQLAALTLDEAGGAQIDGRMRRRAGLRLPGPTPLTMVADEVDPGRAALDAAVDLRVPEGTAHDPSRPALRVGGHATVTGGLTVGQAEPVGYQGVTNDGNDLVVGGQLAAGGGGGSAIYKLGVGYAPPAQEEGTLIARRVGVGRPTLDGGLALQVAGAAQVGPAEVKGPLMADGPATLRNALSVAGPATLQNTAQVGGALTVNGAAHVRQSARVDGASTVGGAQSVGGELTVGGQICATAGVLDLGAGVAGREGNAGKIVYNGWSTDALAIVGAGTQGANRKITLFAEGGLHAAGPTYVDGTLNAGPTTARGNLAAHGNLDVSGSAIVRRDLDTVGNGVVRGRMVVGQTGAEGYGRVVADVNDLVVNGQFAAGGSAGSAMYGLSVGVDAQAGKEGYLFVGQRIGVNTLNPQHRIDVDGTARVTGDTTVGGSMSVGGAVRAAGDVVAGAGAQVAGALSVGGASTVSGAQSVGQALTVDGEIRGAGGTLDLGAGVGGRDGAAGKIVYNGWGTNSLAIVGAGTTGTNRKITLFAEGGLKATGAAEVVGNAAVGGALTVAGNATVSGATTLTGTVAAQNALTVGTRLTVKEGTENGIRFRDNIGGGGGDWAGLRYWVESGEQTRLELGTGNDGNDTLVLKQQNQDVVTLKNAKVGIQVSDPTHTLDVNGYTYLRNHTRLDGLLDLGAKHSGRETNAGKVAYNHFRAGSNRLELVGGGTGGHDRSIEIWAEGGMHVNSHRLNLYGEPVMRSYNRPVRVVWGTVTSGGSVWTGDGFSSSRYGGHGGVFQVHFTKHFSARPTVIAVQHYPNDNDGSDGWGNTKDNCIVSRCYTNWFQVVTGNGDGNREWRSFEFIAIGPV